MRTYYVYIMANWSRNLYTGTTNDLKRRVFEHKSQLVPGFTAKYKLDKLVYFEETGDVYQAISRERQIKGRTREKKLALIEQANPGWEDLAESWYGKPDPSLRSG